MFHSRYLTRAFDADYLADEFTRVVLDQGIEFDILVGTGLSGTLSLAALRAKLGVDIAIVRKPGDSFHATHDIEATTLFGNRRWIFVDDLVASGATRSKVVAAVTNEYPNAMFKGSFLYNPSELSVADAAVFIPNY